MEFELGISIEELFAEADVARVDAERLPDPCPVFADPTGTAFDALCQTVDASDDPNKHVCPGPGRCRHILLNEDRFTTCGLTGVVFAAEHVEESFDNQLCRRSANPDDTSGEMMYGAFRRKRDSASASEAAVISASAIDERKEVVWRPLCENRKQGSSKRGAKCVGESAESEQDRKRVRTPKKEICNGAGRRMLVEDATSVISKLLHCDGLRDSVVADSPTARLANVKVDELVEQLHRRYVRECLSTGRRPNLHTVADIIVGARELVREARVRLKYERAHSAAKVDVQMRERIAQLSVSLWTASCQTPFVKSVSKQDGFRPFVAGVLYGTRRGFTLDDGTELVPCLPDLAAVLPNLRMAAQSSVKGLQASSHRGLCTLVKAINSLASDQERIETFSDCVRIARSVRDHYYSSERRRT